MTCNCIEKINEGLPEHRLDTSVMWSRVANTLTSQTCTALVRRDNGRREGRSSKPSIMAHKFCPFCGVEINPREQAA